MGENCHPAVWVAVRARLNLETLTLILNPQSAVFLGLFWFQFVINVKTWVSICKTLFMVGVSVWVINGCDITINMSTAVTIKTSNCRVTIFIHLSSYTSGKSVAIDLLFIRPIVIGTWSVLPPLPDSRINFIVAL